VNGADDRAAPADPTVGTKSERRLSVSVGGDDGDPDAHTNLVMGFDLSPASRCALEVAADLARRLDARLHVVHVIDLSDYPIDPDASDWEEQAQRTLAQEKETVGAVLKAFNGPWTYHAWHGEPAALLVTVADEYDALMIIIGARRDGFGAAITHMLSRSITRNLTGHRGHRPVLVVPRHAARPQGRTRGGESERPGQS
jgi:nucleotide-binding universal stress UspA family protein